MDTTKPLTDLSTLDEDTLREQKHAALSYIMDAWEDALADGLEPDLIANAALFAALSDLVSTYGEDAVALMTEGLGNRVRRAEFSLRRTVQ